MPCPVCTAAPRIAAEGKLRRVAHEPGAFVSAGGQSRPEFARALPGHSGDRVLLATASDRRATSVNCFRSRFPAHRPESRAGTSSHWTSRVQHQTISRIYGPSRARGGLFKIATIENTLSELTCEPAFTFAATSAASTANRGLISTLTPSAAPWHPPPRASDDASLTICLRTVVGRISGRRRRRFLTGREDRQRRLVDLHHQRLLGRRQ